MKLENEWLENEMRYIKNEMIQGRKAKDSLGYLKILACMLAVFFCCTTAEGKEIAHNNRVVNKAKAVEGGGHTFYCHSCQTRQWHADSNADYAGRFYCRSCKKQLN